MPDSHEIHVALLGEAVDVWRPVLAERLSEAIFRILPQPYDRRIETWQFEPGDTVECEIVDSSEGPILAAVRQIET